MSRLVILMLLSCLLTSQISQTKAAAACNFRGISDCWNQVLSKYCVNGNCDEEQDYCDDKSSLSQCFRVNCDMSEAFGLSYVSMFTGPCSTFVKTESKEK